MFIAKGFDYRIKTMTLATKVRALATQYEKYAKEIADEKFDANIKEALSRAEQIIADSNASKALSTLDAADEKRDSIFRALGTLLKALCSVPIAADNENAKPLLDIYNKYGMATISKSYSEESGDILSLLGDMSAEKTAALTAKLYGVKETLAALKAAQAEFDAASNAYTEANKDNRGKKSASEQKKELNVFFNDKIIRYVNFMIDMGETKFVDFAKAINFEIAKTNE